jgi:hypothetical protein
MHRKLSWLAATALTGALLGLGGCPTRDISKLDPSPAIEYRQDIPVSVNRNVDILFVIDNSDSMKEEQDSLAANFPRFINVLSTIEGGLPNVHIAVVSSDLGLAPFTAEACSGNGDDGLMQNTPRGDCMAPRNGARFIEDIADPSGSGRLRNYDGSLDGVFSCIAKLGNTGCGVEQHLESMKRALDGSHPENGGFLRQDAYLAIIILADEDDCSAKDSAVFNPATQFDNINSEYGPFSSYRCTEFGITCDGNTLPRVAGDYTTCVPRGDSFMRHPQDYVDFLRGLKGDPSLLITAIVSGNPAPVGVTLTTTGSPKLKPSCSSANGVADPGVRLKYFGDQQGLQNESVSICQDDLSDGLNDIAELLARVIGTPCIQGNIDLTDVDPDEPGLQLNCHIADVRFPNTPSATEDVIARCPMQDATTPNTSSLPCWWTTTNAARCSDTPTQVELHVERGTADAPIGTHVIANCLIDSGE